MGLWIMDTFYHQLEGLFMIVMFALFLWCLGNIGMRNSARARNGIEGIKARPTDCQRCAYATLNCYPAREVAHIEINSTRYNIYR